MLREVRSKMALQDAQLAQQRGAVEELQRARRQRGALLDASLVVAVWLVTRSRLSPVPLVSRALAAVLLQLLPLSAWLTTIRGTKVRARSTHAGRPAATARWPRRRTQRATLALIIQLATFVAILRRTRQFAVDAGVLGTLDNDDLPLREAASAVAELLGGFVRKCMQTKSTSNK